MRLNLPAGSSVTTAKRQDFGLTDTPVAAAALHNELSLITDNVKDFPIADLAIYPLPG